MIEFTRQYGRYGYRHIAVLLREALWQVTMTSGLSVCGDVRGKKFPRGNPTRNACGEMTDHVSACGKLTISISGPITLCITGQMMAGLLRTLTLIDDLTRKCLAIRVGQYVREQRLSRPCPMPC